MTSMQPRTTGATAPSQGDEPLPGAGRTALVTGASSGIGAETARSLQRLGYTVYGAARRMDRLAPLEVEGIRPLSMDITDDASLVAGVDKVIAETGRVDVLVNNAGYGSYGAIEDVPLEEARRQFDVNVFGLGRLVQLATPHMREQGSGLIVNVSSMGGRFTTPLGGWYHATKYAVEALSDALRMELAPFGIDVVVVEPGGIRSEWSGIAADHLESVGRSGAYARQVRAVAGTLRNRRMERLQSAPSVIAQTVAEAATATRPKTRYVVGFSAKPLVALSRVLPDRAFDRVIGLAMGTGRG
jgi:NAD(P)-dependent dehydrogenase (short-subunit alcohol dehydrogenase family)